MLDWFTVTAPLMAGNAFRADWTCAAVALKGRSIVVDVLPTMSVKVRLNVPVVPLIVTVWTSSEPFCMSKSGSQVCPPSLVFQTPPPAVAM